MASKKHHTGTMKKSITVKVPKKKVWKKISQITKLSWLEGQENTMFDSKIKTGNGAIRKIKFTDENIVEEHVVGWKKGEYFSYIAVSGLPLRAYHATISLKSLSPKSTQITWQSYFNSQKMSKREFLEFVDFLGSFYVNSLKNLKDELER